MIRRRLGDDRGSVAAEFAVALPAVLLVLILGTATLTTGARHIRLQDAAADAARLAARGESGARVHAAVTDAVPGASVSTEARGDLICVVASAPAAVPLPLVVTATSCALAGGL